jgi:hypothetical protein
MKTKLFRPLFVAALSAAFAFTFPDLRAQDKKEDAPKEEKKDGDKDKDKEKEKEKPSKEEEKDSGEDAEDELNPEEFKKRMKEDEKESNETIRKMLRVFKPLQGEWTGVEKIEHAEKRYKALDKEWKDEWKGFYTVDGRYFEMTGQTQGEDPTSYRWVCTWDVKEETYKAWYFGETSQTLYTGELSKDGKYVVWTVENEETASQTRFSMIPDGDRVKCSGTDRMNNRVFSRQTSNYTRKKVEI